MSSPLDGLHRDEDGQISQKDGNTQVGTLRQTYGDDFAKGYRSDTHLQTVLNDAGADTLSQYIKKHK